MRLELGSGLLSGLQSEASFSAATKSVGMILSGWTERTGFQLVKTVAI